SVRFGGFHAKARVMELGSRDHVRTFEDGFVEQAVGERRGEEIENAEAAGGFARDRDVIRIAAEGRDVALHPAQGFDLVEEAVIAGDVVWRFGAQCGKREVAESTEAIVDGDDYD